MTIGKHVNLVRMKKEMTLEQLAEKSNVSKGTICDWIYRDVVPGADLLILVADALDVSLDELVGRKRQK